jgi:hypothetical protein
MIIVLRNIPIPIFLEYLRNILAQIYKQVSNAI